MGKEAEATLVYRGKRVRGKALLETRELVFRSPGQRLAIPLAGVKVSASDGVLRVDFGETALFELGPAAEKWARAIQNPPSRLDKLGIKPGMKVALVGRFDEDFRAELATRATVIRLGADVDAVFLLAERPADLDKLVDLRARIVPAGAIWTVRKKGGGPVSEKAGMDAGKAAGLVDVKVVAFSPTHTAEKFVIPVSRR
jgi:hypothetical protein